MTASHSRDGGGGCLRTGPLSRGQTLTRACHTKAKRDRAPWRVNDPHRRWNPTSREPSSGAELLKPRGAERPEGSLGYSFPRVCVHRPGWGLRVCVSNGLPETLLVRGGLSSLHAPPHPTYNAPFIQPPAPPANTDAPARGEGIAAPPGSQTHRHCRCPNHPCDLPADPAGG